jgi:hypothetical protein
LVPFVAAATLACASVEAQSRLERAPEGFMRDCTRALIEKHADKIGVMVITAEVVALKIPQVKNFVKSEQTHKMSFLSISKFFPQLLNLDFLSVKHLNLCSHDILTVVITNAECTKSAPLRGRRSWRRAPC